MLSDSKEGELKKHLLKVINELTQQAYVDEWPDEEEAVQKVLDEVKADAPKPRIYTDYSHYYEEDAEGKEHPPYPQYLHRPDGKDWARWFAKWFGSVESKPSVKDTSKS
jgi:hypothetical protein